MPAIPVHHTDTSDASWDAGLNEKRCPAEKAPLRASHAWVDPDADAALRGSYKFIHHEVNADGKVGAANITACRAGIAVLNGARGGANIPDADRKGVYNHLAAHLKDADLEAPDLKRLGSGIERKELQLEIKQVGEDGTFEGMLATYGNLDLGADVIEAGAFVKTIKDNGGQVPMLWQHKMDEPIGTLYLSDTPDGLAVKGVFDLNVQRAREAYSLVKKGIVKGLSIGFDAIRDAIENGIRHLKEIRLWEGSVVTFPMNLRAVITSVKARRAAAEKKDDFQTELQEIQLCAARWQMIQALFSSLEDTIYDSEMTPDQKVATSGVSIDQFRAAYLEMLPDYLALMADMSMGGMMMYSRGADFEKKAGRMLSGASRDMISETMQNLQACMDGLQALLDAADAAESGAAKTATPGTPSNGAAAEPRTAPVYDHSELMQFKNELKEKIRWKN